MPYDPTLFRAIEFRLRQQEGHIGEYAIGDLSNKTIDDFEKSRNNSLYIS